MPIDFITTRICVQRSQSAKFEILRGSPCPVRPVNFPTELDHDVPLSGWDEDDESDHNSRDGCERGEWAANDDVVDDKSADAPVDKAYADSLEVHPVGSSLRAAIIREFLIDIGLPESDLSDDVSKLYGYLHGPIGV